MNKTENKFTTMRNSPVRSTRNKFDAKNLTVGKDILRDMKKTNDYLSNYNRMSTKNQRRGSNI